MKQLFFLLAGLFIFSVSGSAQSKQDVTIVNKTGVIIDQLHIAASDGEDWGEDILGKDQLAVDEECPIEFDPKEDICLWDLVVTDSEGNTLEWNKINLCKVTKMTLHYKDGKGWADLE